MNYLPKSTMALYVTKHELSQIGIVEEFDFPFR